ncbi:MAG: DVU_1551 family NTP transferase [Selenomonadaceae bacterium]
MPNSKKIVGLIVAAGYSSRMGAFKPLLPFGDKTIIETAVTSLRQGGIQDIRVVTGYQAEKLNTLLGRPDVKVINNPNYATGMFSSVFAGLESMEPDIEGFLMLPGDNPLIRRRSIKDVLQMYRKTSAAVVYPAFCGMRGHPPLISAKCFSAIRHNNGNGGLKVILDKFDDDAVDVVVADQGSLIDIDTIDDYNKLIKYYDHYSVPMCDECRAILNKCQAGESVSRHGQAVAAMGYSLAVLLKRAGLKLDPNVVAAAGFLHDVAKGKPHHARRGSRLVKAMGFSAIAEVIATHMDLDFQEDCAIDEAAIVFLVDKLIRGEQRVTFLERFEPSLERFSDQPEILVSIRRRLRTATAIQNKVFQILGICSFNELS